MTRGVFNTTVVNDAGDIQPGAIVEVRTYPDDVLATLYAAASGGAQLSNPYTVGPDAFMRFYADQDRYSITASLNSSESVTWIEDLTGDIGATVNDHETRITQNETDIAALQSVPTDQSLIGGWDASSGTFPTATGGTTVGNYWIVETAGTMDGVTFAVNDELVAIVDAPNTALYAGNWFQRVGGTVTQADLDAKADAVIDMVTINANTGERNEIVYDVDNKVVIVPRLQRTPYDGSSYGTAVNVVGGTFAWSLSTTEQVIAINKTTGVLDRIGRTAATDLSTYVPLVSMAIGGITALYPLPIINSDQIPAEDEVIAVADYRHAMDRSIEEPIQSVEQYDSGTASTGTDWRYLEATLTGSIVNLGANSRSDCSSIPLNRKVRYRVSAGPAYVYSGADLDDGTPIAFDNQGTNNYLELQTGATGVLHRTGNAAAKGIVTHAPDAGVVETYTQIAEPIKDECGSTSGQSLGSQLVTHGGLCGLARALADGIGCTAITRSLHLENGATGSSAVDSRSGKAQYWRDGNDGSDGPALTNWKARIDRLVTAGYTNYKFDIGNFGPADADAIASGALTPAQWKTSMLAVYTEMYNYIISSGVGTDPKFLLVPIGRNDLEKADDDKAFSKIRAMQMEILAEDVTGYIIFGGDFYWQARGHHQPHFTWAGNDMAGLTVAPYVANVIDGQTNSPAPLVNTVTVAPDKLSAVFTFTEPLGFNNRMPTGSGLTTTGKYRAYGPTPFDIELLSNVNERLPLDYADVDMEAGTLTVYGDMTSAGTKAFQSPAGANAGPSRARDNIIATRKAGGSYDSYTLMLGHRLATFRVTFL